MKPTTIIIGILLFALATMILYTWGLLKQRNQERDLMNMLFQKGADRVKKYLKKHETISEHKIKSLCEGLSARQPFSNKKAVVRDSHDFTKKLIEYMMKTKQIEKDRKEYRLPVKTKK